MNEFYEQPDSCYVKLCFEHEQERVHVSTRYEILHRRLPAEITADDTSVVLICKGILEMVLHNTQMLYDLGLAAHVKEYIELAKEETSDLLKLNPKGSA